MTKLEVSDQTRDDINIVVGGLSTGLTAQWILRRTLRKIGPVLAKIHAGEELSAKDAKLLLTIITLSVYVVARTAYAGWRAAQESGEATDRLAEQFKQYVETQTTTEGASS